MKRRSDLADGHARPLRDGPLRRRVGDFNPIHIDEEFARSVGLPGRILHGLWTMAQVARAHTEAAGGPGSVRCALSVQFRGMGAIEQEVTVRGTVVSVADGVAVVSSEATQAGRRIVRNGRAEVSLPAVD